MAATEEIRGVGHSVKRLEDARFIRRQLLRRHHAPRPEFLRSPFAHARITSIDTSGPAAEGVVAVVTGELMAQHNLAWMPTPRRHPGGARHGQGALPGQEVAAVIAESAYIAKDACELIDVDYELLEVITSLSGRYEGAAVIRDEKEGQTTTTSTTGRPATRRLPDRAFAEADKVVELDTFYPRCHRSSARASAARQPRHGEGHDLHDLAGPARAPHALRVVACPSTRSGSSRPTWRRLRNKVPIYPGYVVATAASLLIGRPVKWVEDRTGNLISTGFARDYHMHGELALKDGKITGLRVKMFSDNGAFFSTRSRRRARRGSSTSSPAPTTSPPPTSRRPGVHEQGAGRRRLPLLVPRHRGLYLIERLVQNAAYELGVDPADFRKQNFIKPEQFPYKSATGFEYDSGDYRRPWTRAGEDRLRRPPPRAGGARKGS